MEGICPLGEGWGSSWDELVEETPITRQKIQSDILPMNSPHCPQAPLTTPLTPPPVRKSDPRKLPHLLPARDSNLVLGSRKAGFQA